jgi:hypothetical protein
MPPDEYPMSVFHGKRSGAGAILAAAAAAEVGLLMEVAGLGAVAHSLMEQGGSFAFGGPGSGEKRLGIAARDGAHFR